MYKIPDMCFTKSEIVSGLGFASEDLYSNIIDDTRINSLDFGAGIVTSVATSGLGGSKGGRFVSGFGAITKSDIIAARGEILQSTIVKASQGFVNLLNNLINNYNVANANQASGNQGAGTSSGGGGSDSSGNSIQQAIKAAGGSTLKTAERRAASESIAASIISRQRVRR